MTSIGSMLSPMPSPPRTLEWNPDWNRSYTAAQCVAASGAATFRQAYRALFDQACALGLLPESADGEGKPEQEKDNKAEGGEADV